MSKVTDVGEVIALREMTFVYDDGREEAASLKVGKPIPSEEFDAWSCPYELCTASHRKIHAMVGGGSLQALELTMRTLPAEVQFWERSKKGKFWFLGDEGAGI